MSTFIKKFQTQTEYNTFKNSVNYVEPNVSMVNGESISYNVEFPKVRILTKVASGSDYKYTTSPDLYELWYNTSNGSTSGTYTVYFNNQLFTNTTKLVMGSGSYDWSEDLHLHSNSNNANYKYYFHAHVSDGAQLSFSDMYAILPDSFGSVGDEVTVRIFKN